MKRIKCEFDSTGTLAILRDVFLLTALFAFSVLMALSGVGNHYDKYIKVTDVSFIILIVCVAAAVIFQCLKAGIIYALSDQIIITHKFLFRRVLVSKIDYRNIEYADYKIEQLRSRVCFYCYVFVLVIHLRNGKILKIRSELEIPEKLPTDDPDSYKEYINNQPMMKLCRYINEKSR